MLTDVVQSSAVVGGAGWNPTTECSNNILIPYIYKCTFKDQRGLCVHSRRNEWDLYSAVAQGLLDLSVILFITVWYSLFNKHFIFHWFDSSHSLKKATWEKFDRRRRFWLVIQLLGLWPQPKKVLGLIFVWISHVVPMSVWLPSGYSGLLE